jgi:DivIVA domain-containing protein
MAADEQATDLIPLLSDDEPHFDIAMRGYDRRQVEEYVGRIEAELVEAQVARDTALATSADRAAQLANREAHIESLKRQAIKATEKINPSTVSDRIRDMLQLATDEAAQTRRAAEEEAERVLSAAKADAERVRTEAAAEQQRLVAAAKQRSAEADQKLARARLQASTELDGAKTEIKKLAEAAAAERARLDAAAQAARDDADRLAEQGRKTADDDFEITLRTRRSAAEKAAQADQEAAAQLARTLVSDANAEAAKIKADQAETHRSLKELHAKLGRVISGLAKS